MASDICSHTGKKDGKDNQVILRTILYSRPMLSTHYNQNSKRYQYVLITENRGDACKTDCQRNPLLLPRTHEQSRWQIRTKVKVSWQRDTERHSENQKPI